VIPKVAALAAKEHGDARKAIDILRYTGEIADEHGDDHVRAEYVDEAHEREEEARLAELIGKQPEHSKYLLQGLALQMQQSTDPDAMIPSKHVYSAYEVVCEREGTDPLKIRRVRDPLRTRVSLVDRSGSEGPREGERRTYDQSTYRRP